MNIEQSKNLDILEYLEKIGITPKRKRGTIYYFLSPLREEKTPSFIVDSIKNYWTDHGTGKGGDLLKFVCLLHNVDTSEGLNIISKKSNCPVIISHNIKANKPDDSNPVIIVNDVSLYRNSANIRYLTDRGINIKTASMYCSTIYYTYKDRQKNKQRDLFCVGFKTNSGSYELSGYKNANGERFKSCTSPKDITTFKVNKSETVYIFEGFIDYLSMLTRAELTQLKSTVIVLNSLSNINKAIEISKDYKRVILYLDNDPPGKEAALIFAEAHPKVINDSDRIFPEYEDYNDFVLNIKMKPK